MPSIFTHAFVGLMTGKIITNKKLPRRFWLLSVLCPALPDADVLAFHFGIPYRHFFGHRGFFHSPFFALLLSLLVVSVFFRDKKFFSKGWWIFLGYFFLITASHGLLDAFTNGGAGIALLSPFSNDRFFAPWRPIMVSPIGIGTFLRLRRWLVLTSEFLWVWLPMLGLWLIVKTIRKTTTPPKK